MWIKSVAEDEATGIVAKIYKGTSRSWGGVDNIIKAHISIAVPKVHFLLR